MRVLWVSASPIGPSSRILGKLYGGSSGGWIQTVYSEIDTNKCELFFLCFSRKVPNGQYIKKTNEEGTAFCFREPIVHYGFKYPKKLKKNVENCINKIKPDIIHVWGTETNVQNMIIDCCPSIPKVVFIQGLIGVHNRYHGGYLKKAKLKMRMSPILMFRNMIKNILFSKQAKFEKKELLKAQNVISDSDFVKAYCLSISRTIRVYDYYLNANKVFLDKSWSYTHCEKNRLFTVYGGGPDKGIHQLIIALGIVKTVINDFVLHIPGPYHLNGNKLAKKYLSPYERLLSKLIHNNCLENNIVFDGQLSPNQMADSLIRANVFINPSIMEVHASSLREAMTIGTPSISTTCGSVVELINDGHNGYLYRYEEPEVLAYRIIKLLTNNELATLFSENSRARMKHLSKQKQKKSLLDIYEVIYS